MSKRRALILSKAAAGIAMDRIADALHGVEDAEKAALMADALNEIAERMERFLGSPETKPGRGI